MKDNDDLLELFDDDQEAEFDYFETQKEERNDVFYSIITIGFLVVLGIRFFQTLPGDGPNEDAIIMRQAQLLRVVQTTQDSTTVQAAIQEYDSLEQVLQSIQSE